MSSGPNSSKFDVGPVRRLQLAWVRRRWVDVAVATFVVAAWLILGWKGWVPLALEEVRSPQRQAFYQVIATISGTMGGFTLTSVSVLINLMRTPLRDMDNFLPLEDKRRVGDVVVNVLPSLGILFILAICGLLVDTSTGGGHWWIQAVVVISLVTAFLSIARIIWVLRRLLVATS